MTLHNKNHESDSNHDNELMGMGFQLGLYTCAKMVLEANLTDGAELQAIMNIAAREIQDSTGMPIEDFEGMVELSTAKMINKLANGPSHNQGEDK